VNLELPGQMRGPECHRVMRQAIALRKEMEPWFGALPQGSISKLVVILRIDGSLGTFGPSGVENVKRDGTEIQCDLVISDPGWGQLSEGEIRELLLREVSCAIDACLDSCRIPFVREEFEALFRRTAA
jgi:hypothetical protein